MTPKTSTSWSGHRVAADQAAAPVLALADDPTGIALGESPAASHNHATTGADQ